LLRLLEAIRLTHAQGQESSGSVQSSNAPPLDGTQTKSATGTAGHSSITLVGDSVTNAGGEASIRQPTPSASTTLNVDSLFVFLAVKTGQESQLAQIQAHNLQDDLFFDKLRSEYQRLRGRLRGLLSIWMYSHCDFVQV
jgi:hypothetical protein